jgi:hypothetical protein
MTKDTQGRLPEVKLVVALLRWPLTDERIESIRGVVGAGVDWVRVFQVSVHWGVEALVCGNLRRHLGAHIPPEVTAEASRIERESRALTLARTLELTSLVNVFARENVEVIVLKGPAIGMAAFGDASLRSFTDFDLLVRREAIERSRDLLLRAGYGRDYPASSESDLVRFQHALEFSGRRSRVELHWNLLEWYLSVDTDVDAMWSTAVSIEVAGTSMRVLSPARQFAYACEHGAKHQWLKPKWIVDISQLAMALTDADEPAIRSIARSHGSERALKLALQLAEDITGPYPSPFSSEFFSRNSATRSLAAEVRWNLGFGSQPRPDFYKAVASLDARIGPLLFWIRARERVADKLEVIRRLMKRKRPPLAASSDASRRLGD